jgi:hypothetical protein
MTVFQDGLLVLAASLFTAVLSEGVQYDYPSRFWRKYARSRRKTRLFCRCQLARVVLGDVVPYGNLQAAQGCNRSLAEEEYVAVGCIVWPVAHPVVRRLPEFGCTLVCPPLAVDKAKEKAAPATSGKKKTSGDEMELARLQQEFARSNMLSMLVLSVSYFFIFSTVSSHFGSKRVARVRCALHCSACRACYLLPTGVPAAIRAYKLVSRHLSS